MRIRRERSPANLSNMRTRTDAIDLIANPRLLFIERIPNKNHPAGGFCLVNPYEEQDALSLQQNSAF